MYLVSVGTTRFDGLVEAVDRLSRPGGLIQIANGRYLPKNLDYLHFTNDLKKLIQQADFVICHAGAGVLFESLQRGKKVICVPNMERSDKHQIEIAEELGRRGLVLLVRHVKDLKEAIEHIGEFKPRVFDIPGFQAETLCRLSGIKPDSTVAVLASGGGHLEEARILADKLLTIHPCIAFDFYIPFNASIRIKEPKNSLTIHFQPYNAKYRNLIGWAGFLASVTKTIRTSLQAAIPRKPSHVISVGTADTAFLFARLGMLGAKRVIIESRARVRSVSYTAKILPLLNSEVYKQWGTSTLNAPAIGVLYDDYTPGLEKAPRGKENI